MSVQRTTKSLGIVDLLKLRGFDPTRPTKLVRHAGEYDVIDFLRRGWFEFYQATQSQPIFDGCERLVSFIGTEGTTARFVGVYRVKGKVDNDCRPRPGPAGFPADYADTDRYCYDLEREAGYEDLENRVVIEWGPGTINWHQWLLDKKKGLNNKEVVELLPKGQLRPPFRDYLEFTLTHDELKELYKHPDAYKAWRDRLAVVAGVYLVLATTTGKQYVGSAYGTEGIWGRWAAYARNGHGGNKQLRELVENDPAYPGAFRYTVLQILPRTLARSEVLNWEQLYKRKLGSRATGLNVK